MKIAIIGSGIAGNVVAHHLHREHEITLYEAGGHAGGHTHTHIVEQAGRSYRVDTGFIVFNRLTYPNFIALLDELGVESQESSMSFSVRCESSGLEYNGTTLNSLFAQRRNLLRPSFLGMIRDILRFNREAPALLDEPGGELPLREFLARGRYGQIFIDHYIVPMAAAIWSTDPQSDFFVPGALFHPLLLQPRHAHRERPPGLAHRARRLGELCREAHCAVSRPHSPQHTGRVVRRLPGSVILKARGLEPQCFDAAFLACHSDQALRILADPSALERDVLGAIAYQPNEAILHTDTRLLPRKRLARAAWNYHVLAQSDRAVALTYNMNILQRLDAPTPFLVTLNRSDAIDPERIIKRMEYRHPVYTPASVAAQARQRDLNGQLGTYYSGAWWGNGFHEDGVTSALAAIGHFREDYAQRAVYRSA